MSGYSSSISKSLVALIAVITIFLTVPAASAQPISPISMSLAVGPMGGETILQGDAGNSFNNGYHIGGFAWLSFGQFGARAEGNYHKLKTPGGYLGAPKIEGNLKLTGFLISGTYAPLPTPLIKPYVIAGAGSYKVKVKISDSSVETTTETESSAFAFAGGVGAKLQAGKIGAFLEARYLRISTENEATKSILISGGLLLALI